jgi:hypothetical protein
MTPLDLDREARHGRVAGILAGLSVGLTIAAVPVAATDVEIRSGGSNDLTFLTSVGHSGTGQTVALVMRVLAVAFLVPLTVFLFRAIRARNPEHSRAIPILGFVAFAVVGVTTVVGFVEVRDVAREFVASGPQTLRRAEHVLHDARSHGTLRISNVIGLVGGLLFGIWISLTSFELMRVGLLTRFLGVFGLGAGMATAIGIPIGSAMFLGWAGSVACLCFGYWPGGRPSAWKEPLRLGTVRPG